MDLTTYEDLLKSETSARKFLVKNCWKNHQRFCPRCKCRKLYTLHGAKAMGKRRCSRCSYTFHDFSKRFLNRTNLSARQWLRLIKLFELEVPLDKMVNQLDLAYNTVFKAVSTIRWAILYQALDARHILESGPFLGLEEMAPTTRADLENPNSTFSKNDTNKRPQPTPPVFGVLERGDRAFVDLAQDISPETVLFFKQSFYLKTIARGSIIYTDKFQHYDALVFCCPKTLKAPGITHKDRGLYIDTTNGFWPYAKKRLKRFKGISPRRFPLYIKELEFRHNYKKDDLFQMITKHLCEFVPNYA